MNFAVWLALAATVGTWLMTALGAGSVVFFRRENVRLHDFTLGFAAGVMVAASYWSLLAPAVERAKDACRLPPAAAVTVGFLGGAAFLILCDLAVRRASDAVTCDEGKKGRLSRILLPLLSITLHNVPEGLAVGVAFGALSGDVSAEAVMGAVTVAVGIGLQNFPEGAAVALPLRREGYSRRKSFFLGQASGIVEPIGGLIGALAVVRVESVLPYALSFAAGAMIAVCVHEMIPDSQENRSKNPYVATAGILTGFCVMMLLDVALG